MGTGAVMSSLNPKARTQKYTLALSKQVSFNGPLETMTLVIVMTQQNFHSGYAGFGGC